MGETLEAERAQAAERETRQRATLEEAGKRAVATAWEHAQAEHERVLAEAEAHAAQLAAQHEAALAAALAQKDGQLGHRLEEYEGQLARLVDEGAEVQRRTKLAVRQAATACDDARAEMQAAQGTAEAALRDAMSTLGAEREAALRGAHERVLQQERASHALALEAVEAEAAAGMRSTLGSLAEAQQESNARHAAAAAALAQTVAQLNVAREQEVGGVAAEHQAALARLRDEYEGQLTRAHKLSEETWAALRAHSEQTLDEQAATHATQVEALEREKAAIKEERTAGWAHLPLPELLRQAMDEGLAKLRDAHAQQLDALHSEHAAALERIEREAAAAQQQAEAAVAKQAELSVADVEMARQAAQLDAEQARARALDELNAKTEGEVQLLREEQVHILRQRLEEESQRIKADESARVAAEQEQLRALSAELEHDLHFAESARHAMAVNANEAMAEEIERLSNELKAARKAKVPAGKPKPGRPSQVLPAAPAPKVSDRPTPKSAQPTPTSKPTPKGSSGDRARLSAGRGRNVKA